MCALTITTVLFLGDFSLHHFCDTTMEATGSTHTGGRQWCTPTDLLSDKGKNSLFSYLKSEAYFTQNPISLCNLLPCQLLSVRLQCMLSGNIAKAKRRERSLLIMQPY